MHFYGEGIGGYSHLAVAGGVTTFIGMIRGRAKEPLARSSTGTSVRLRRGGGGFLLPRLPLRARGYPLIASGPRQRGFRSFKLFLAYKRRGMMVSERFLFDAFEAIALSAELR